MFGLGGGDEGEGWAGAEEGEEGGVVGDEGFVKMVGVREGGGGWVVSVLSKSMTESVQSAVAMYIQQALEVI